MKRVLSILLLMTMVFSVLAGCTKEPGTTEPAATTAAAAGETTAAAVEPVKILNLINGTLGDMSFFDSSERGMQAIAAKYGDKVQVKTIEMSLDQTKWQPTLEDEVGGDWDVIIVGTWQMVDMLQKVAPENPEKNFIIYDSSVDYAAGDFKNVYSITFKQNEGSYLAGALAAKLSTTQKIGFLGGMDIPVINDFLVGYIEGAKATSPDVKVAVSYIGSFGDSAKGKEMAAAQYSQGVDIGFNVAGQAGLGQIDAARDAKKLAIGVDSDQAMLFATSDPEKAAVIPTSMLKNIEPCVALLSHSNFGSHETPGSVKMRKVRELLLKRVPKLNVDGEMQGDTAWDEALRHQLMPNSTLKGRANLFVLPNLDAANIAYNMVRVVTEGVAIGPILMGLSKPVHILTTSATPRRILNMTAIAAVDAQIREQMERR